MTGSQAAAAVRAGYDTEAGAALWTEGPARHYAELAQALVAAAPMPPAGLRVLDVGAGTGVAGRIALAAGASQVVAADLAPAMLRRCGTALHPVTADAAAMPFRDGSFGLAVAAFCLNHMSDVAAGLREIRRVAGSVAVSTYPTDWSHPAKNVVDEVLAGFGYQSPGWHVALKEVAEPRAGDPEFLARCAAQAGFGEVRVRTVEVATGPSSPAELVSWRLGLAQNAAFFCLLDEAAQAGVRRAAERAVAQTGAGLVVVPMLVLTGR